jgi:hypothetical protein
MGTDCRAIVKMKNGSLKYVSLSRHTDFYDDEEELDYILREYVGTFMAVMLLIKLRSNRLELKENVHWHKVLIVKINEYKHDIEAVRIVNEHHDLYSEVKEEL